MGNLDSGEEKIEDSGTVASLRRIARKVHVKALLTSLVLTGIALVILEESNDETPIRTNHRYSVSVSRFCSCWLWPPVKLARKTRAFVSEFSPTKAISISWVLCIFEEGKLPAEQDDRKGF